MEFKKPGKPEITATHNPTADRTPSETENGSKVIETKRVLENPDVIASILALKEDNNRTNQDRLINAVIKGRFISPVTLDPAPPQTSSDGQVKLDKNTKINFHLIKNPNGDNYYPVFTDWAELRKGQHSGNQHTLVLTFKDYSALVLKNKDASSGFVINPFSDNVVFSTAMIQQIQDVLDKNAQNGEVQLEKIPPNTQIKLGDFSIRPVPMIEAASKHFDKVGNVKSAYLLAMLKDEKDNYLFVLDCEGDVQETFKAFGDAIKPYLNGLGLAITPLNSELGQKAASSREPIYVRD